MRDFTILGKLNLPEVNEAIPDTVLCRDGK